jgi:hypothetical protein
VEQVIPRIEELNGQTVSVAGYLSYCDTYHCPLFRNKEDADEWGRFIEVAQATGRRPPSVPDDPMLGIGSGTNMDFDAKAAPFWNSYVVITGTITDERRVDGEPVCSDRAPDLEPRDIRAGRAPAPR